MAVIAAAREPTLGDTLELARLRHRARRLEQVLRVLEARRLYRQQRDGAPPPALLEARAAFADELAEVRERMVALLS